MKNFFKLLPVVLLGLALAACDDDNDAELPAQPELRVLTFEDNDYRGTDNGGLGFKDWTSLIDKVQNNGPLLYPGDDSEGAWRYNWNDENNTFLASKLPRNYDANKFWGGGHAVSNYADTDLTHGDPAHQLSVYGNGGHNGSKNFCIHNGYAEAGDENTKLPSIYFSDGVKRVVDHMWVANTTYVANIIVNGDKMNTPFGEEDFLVVTAVGRNLVGDETGRTEIFLARGTDYLKEWTNWNLSSLGEVASIEFNVKSSKRNQYGMSVPGYFAYDDVAVRF